MSKCDDKQDEFLKNEYILNLDRTNYDSEIIYIKKKLIKNIKLLI